MQCFSVDTRAANFPVAERGGAEHGKSRGTLVAEVGQMRQSSVQPIPFPVPIPPNPIPGPEEPAPKPPEPMPEPEPDPKPEPIP